MKKKKIVYILIALTTFIVIICMLNFVGFHYPHIIENEPLKSPVKVAQYKNSKLFLEDGRVIHLDDPDNDLVIKQLEESEYTVDIEEGDGWAVVYAIVDGWICGSPWTKPIQIPIFRDTVYRNKRQIIGLSIKIENSTQQDEISPADKHL